MAVKYLIDCSCGKRHEVSTHQAGARIACPCGAEVEVPPLRKLRELPSVPEAATAPAARPWGLRHELVTGGSLATLALLLWAGWLWYSRPEIPQFEAKRYHDYVDTSLENSAPLDLWLGWMQEYRSIHERGFYEFTSTEREVAKNRIDQRQLYSLAVLALAAVTGLATAIAAALAPAMRRR